MAFGTDEARWFQDMEGKRERDRTRDGADDGARPAHDSGAGTTPQENQEGDKNLSQLGPFEIPEGSGGSGSYETRCCTCGRPYIYWPEGGCRPDWCAYAPACITNADWREYLARVRHIEDRLDSVDWKLTKLAEGIKL